jgi:DNA-binding transcriptional LysR family regulator
MTLDGIGVGTLPLQYIRAELEDGQLKVVRSSWKPSDLVFTASYPREPYNRLAERVSALAVEVAQEFNRFR